MQNRRLYVISLTVQEQCQFFISCFAYVNKIKNAFRLGYEKRYMFILKTMSRGKLFECGSI